MTRHTWCSHPAEVSVHSDCCIEDHYVQDFTEAQWSFWYSVGIVADLLPHEEADRLNDVKFLVQQLYTTLRIEEHQLTKERELIGRLEDLNSQLQPLEKVC